MWPFVLITAIAIIAVIGVTVFMVRIFKEQHMQQQLFWQAHFDRLSDSINKMADEQKALNDKFVVRLVPGGNSNGSGHEQARAETAHVPSNKEIAQQRAFEKYRDFPQQS